MPNVLFVSYRFAPEASAGSVRSNKFAKYLAPLGWRITVLCASNPSPSACDPQSIAELPEGIRFRRIRSIEPAAVRTWLEERLPRKLSGIGWRIERLLDSLYYPDFSAVWLLGALGTGIFQCLRVRPDAIYSTFAPVSNHIVGLALSTLFRIPLVADYRDLWVHDFEYRPRSRLREWLDRKLEHAICARARAILTTSYGLTEIMRQAYPKAIERIITLPNGFDPQDAPMPPPHHNSERLTLAHVGTLYSSRSIQPFLTALTNAIAETSDLHGKVVLRLVGNVNTPLLNAGPIRIERDSWCPRHAAIQEMANADVCILVLHSAPGGNHPVPQKLYEYLAFGRFVLALGRRPCFAEEIIRCCPNGMFVSIDDPDSLQSAASELLSLFARGKLKSIPRNDHLVGQFSRLALAATLANVLSAVVSGTTVRSYDFLLNGCSPARDLRTA